MLILTFNLLLIIELVASSTVMVRPSTGLATLIPGQSLHFQCEMVERKSDFIWVKREPGRIVEHPLEPGQDETIEILNDKLTLHKPSAQYVGDYICRALKPDQVILTMPDEHAMVRVRLQPYIGDFGIETSHSGKSAIVNDGERVELTCRVYDESTPVNITWLRSQTPDDERTMVPLVESAPATGEVSDTSIGGDHGILVESKGEFTKRLIIESAKAEHRSYYVCIADNGVAERSRKVIYIRVKDKLVALWPFLGIVAELFILFTIIYLWETQRAYKEMQALAKQQSEEGRSLRSG